MIIDYNKAIYDTIGYNHLNLPQSITIAGGRKNINYIWDAVGNKLSTRTAFLKDLPDDTIATTRTEYIGNFVYKEDDKGNLKPAYILHEEGMIVVDDDGDYHYDYYIKDHLGNTRLVQRVTGETTETIQQTDYYPFGMIMGGRDAFPGDDDNRYLYNSKELQDMFDLGWYDYGARMYDPVLARFHTVDLLSEVYSFQSPYAYAANNPILYIDYMGMGPSLWERIRGWARVNVLKRGWRSGYELITPEQEEREVTYSRKTKIKHGLTTETDSRWGKEVSFHHSFDDSFRSNVIEQGVIFNRHIDGDGLEVSQERIYKKEPKTILIADDPGRTRVLRPIMRFLGLNMGNRINVSFQGKYPDLIIPEPTAEEKEFFIKHNLPYFYAVGTRRLYYQKVLRLYGTKAYFEELERAGIIEKMEN